MATPAFKSTSRRATAADSKAPAAAAARRRSHSVSAVSRRTLAQSDHDTLISTEFSNSRENPLFWVPSHSPPGGEEGKVMEAVSSNVKQLETRNAGIANSNSDRDQRGRSVTRSVVNKNGIGRSLSRVRGRSVSRGPFGGAHESKKQLDAIASTIDTGRNTIKKIGNGLNRTNSVRGRSDTQSRSKNAEVPAIQNQALEGSEDDSACSLQISNLEDGLSIGSLSDGEEKTIKPLMGEKWAGGVPPNQIYETVQSELKRAIMDIQNDLERAFQRNNGSTVSATHDGSVLSGLVDSESEAVELVTDIRREYAMKLEESEERARKLRADLAIEEHRGQELGRILKEIVPDPKPSDIQRSRRGRKTSNERRRMSKRLSEEAMAYFDECVSISTFDSSDFSAPEDPQCGSVGGTLPSGASSLIKGSPRTSCSYEPGEGPHQDQPYSFDDRRRAPNRTSTNLGITRQLSQFSFAAISKSENTGPREDIRSCIKIFERGSEKDTNSEPTTLSCYDAGEYNAYRRIESMHIERVLNSSRIQSGGLLLCSGAALSSLPFASVML